MHILLNSYLKGLVVHHLNMIILMQNTIEEQTAGYKVFRHLMKVSESLDQNLIFHL